MDSINGNSERPIPASRPTARSWDIDVCLISGRIVTQQAVASGAREAVEATLAKLALTPEQVSGVAAQPGANGRAA